MLEPRCKLRSKPSNDEPLPTTRVVALEAPALTQRGGRWQRCVEYSKPTRFASAVRDLDAKATRRLPLALQMTTRARRSRCASFNRDDSHSFIDARRLRKHHGEGAQRQVNVTAFSVRLPSLSRTGPAPV